MQHFTGDNRVFLCRMFLWVLSDNLTEIIYKDHVGSFYLCIYDITVEIDSNLEPTVFRICLLA